MTPEIAKLGHVALVTPDLAASQWFFRDIVGLEQTDEQDDTIFVRAWGDNEHHSLTLTAGPQAVVDHIGWRTKRPEHVDAFARALESQGVEVTHVAPDEEPGQGRAVRFRLPFGSHPFELYYDIERPGAQQDRKSRMLSNVRSWDHTISPRRLDHVNVHTDNAGLTERWLEQTLGFKIREYVRDEDTVLATFMAVTSLSHDIAVFTDLEGRANRFHHLAYYLDNWQDVLRAMDILAEHHIPIDFGPVRHGVGQAFTCYVKDPGSGHRLELCSGGYHIFDPDWEPLEWGIEDLTEVVCLWGVPEWLPGTGGPMDATTACSPLAPQPA